MESSPLVRLPPEIRLKIYRCLLCCDHPVEMVRAWDYQGDNALHPAILRTCRSIYHEAFPVLYTENGFAGHAIKEDNQHVSKIVCVAVFIYRPSVLPGSSESSSSHYSWLIDDLSRRANLKYLVIHVYLPGHLVDLTEGWCLDGLASALVQMGCTAKLTFKPTDRVDRRRSLRFSKEDEAETRKVVAAVEGANTREVTD